MTVMTGGVGLSVRERERERGWAGFGGELGRLSPGVGPVGHSGISFFLFFSSASLFSFISEFCFVF
jgi:hypothetical protein